MNHKIIADKYELLTIIGKTKSSTVYLGRNIKLDKNWAIKEIKKDAYLNDGQLVENKLMAEANMMKNLDHSALPTIVDIIEEHDRYYIVMEYIEGKSLKDIVHQYGKQEQSNVVKWGLELLSVLHYLHTQEPPIIYRDMKPGNIILQDNGKIRLIDFGIARTYKMGKTEDTSPLGTRGYAAPEQFDEGEGQPGQTDARTDIYGLGITLYVLLTGEKASSISTTSIREVDSDISIGIEKIIEKSTRLNPDDRFESAQEMYRYLSNYERLDDNYRRRQKHIIKRTIIPFMVGMALVLAGICLMIANAIISGNKYDALTIRTGNHMETISNLKKAVELKPEKPDAYILLIEEYASDEKFTEKEAESVMSIYLNNISDVNVKSNEYCKINYALGETYLLYFTGESDNSLRNRLLNARPFFDAVVQTENKEYENYEIAKSYSYICNYYKDYIIATDVVVKEAKDKEYKKLVKSFDEALTLVGKQNNENQMKIITYDVIANILNMEKNNIAATFTKYDFLKMLNTIETGTNSINTSNEKLIKNKKSVIDNCNSIRDEIDATYTNLKKERLE